MARKKIRIIPYDSIEFFAVESWLAEQAKKGWQLQSIHGNLALFEKSTPRKTRYCLDALNVEKYAMEQELHEAAEKQGWEYICDYAWHSYGVYRSDNADAVAFHTDLSVRQASMRRRMIFILVGFSLLALIILHQFLRPNGLIAVFRGSAGSEIYLGNGLIKIICAVLLLLFWLVFALFCFGSFRRAMRDLEVGMAGSHPSAALLTVCRLFLTTCVLVVVSLLLIGRKYSVYEFQPLPDQMSLHVPLWQTIDADEYQRAQAGRPDEPSFDDDLMVRHSPFADEILSVRQGGNYQAINISTGVMNSFYDADECVMRSERYAERTFELLSQEGNCEALPSTDGFDEAVWGRYNTAQTLVLRRDNTVIWAFYNGEADLRDQIHVFADVLRQGDRK